jgi:iron(III) transport system ATP-binding protein
MRGGKVRQEGPAADVYMNPVSADVAASLGPVNRLAASDVPAGLAEVAQGTELVVRPEGICLDPGSQVHATVLASQVTGAMNRLVLDAAGQRLVALVPRHEAPKAGEKVGIRLDPALSFMFPSAKP